MSAATRKLRLAVFARSEGCCEAECGRWVGHRGEQGHLDHFFGRAKAPATVATCWGLCPTCDAEKTTSTPTAAHWLKLFAKHCDLHGYTAEAERARTRLQFVTTRTELAAPRVVTP